MTVTKIRKGLDSECACQSTENDYMCGDTNTVQHSSQEGDADQERIDSISKTELHSNKCQRISYLIYIIFGYIYQLKKTDSLLLSSSVVTIL